MEHKEFIVPPLAKLCAFVLATTEFTRKVDALYCILCILGTFLPLDVQPKRNEVS